MNILLRISVASLALCCSVLGGSIASAATIKKMMIGNWQAGAYSNDTTGAFNHCAASSSYRSGLLLLFAVNRNYGWSIGFASPSWRLDKGSRYPIAFRVDGGRALEGNALAVSDKFVEVALADSAALFEAFRYGSMLKVYAAGKTFGFQLTDTSAVLPSLLACVKAYRDQAPGSSPANPFVAEAPRPAAPAGNADAFERRAEAVSLVANILARSKVQGFEIMSPEDSQKFKSDAGWRSGEAFGTMNIVATEKTEDINASILSSDSKACRGRFFSGSMPDELGSRMFTSCKSDAQTVTVYYTTIKRPKGGYYILATGAFERPARTIDKPPVAAKPTNELDSGIRSAAFKVVTPAK